MKHTTILIITTKNTITLQYPIDILVVSESIDLIDDFSLNTSSEIIHFDYLVVLNTELIQNIPLLSLYYDGNTIVTNYYQQSNIDHIYYVSESDQSLNDKLDKALHHICYGE
jgi:hypothetical protein